MIPDDLPDLSDVRANLRDRAATLGVRRGEGLVERSLVIDFLDPHLVALEDEDADDPHEAVRLLEEVEEAALALKEFLLDLYPAARKRRPPP